MKTDSWDGPTGTAVSSATRRARLDYWYGNAVNERTVCNDLPSVPCPACSGLTGMLRAAGLPPARNSAQLTPGLQRPVRQAATAARGSHGSQPVVCRVTATSPHRRTPRGLWHASAERSPSRVHPPSHGMAWSRPKLLVAVVRAPHPLNARTTLVASRPSVRFVAAISHCTGSRVACRVARCSSSLGINIFVIRVCFLVWSCFHFESFFCGGGGVGTMHRSFATNAFRKLESGLFTQDGAFQQQLLLCIIS